MSNCRAVILGIVATAVLSPAAQAQQPTPAGRVAPREDVAALLETAIRNHREFAAEEAVLVLNSVVDHPAATTSQLATAYKYLGASMALLGRADSAVAFFVMALSRDSTIQMDPRVFAATEIAAFDRGRARFRSTPAGHLRIATRHSAARIYVDDVVDGRLAAARWVRIPAGMPVRLSIRAEGCAPWDTTITVQAGEKAVIGRRNPRCP